MAPTSQAASGLDRHDQRLVPVHLSGNDGLLLIAAGHASGRGHRPLSGADVVLFDQPLGVAPDLVVPDKSKMLELGLPIPLEHQILLQGEVQHQAVLVPVLRDVAHILPPAADGGMRIIPATERHGPGGALVQAGEAVDQLRLAVAVNAGDAQDLPARASKLTSRTASRLWLWEGTLRCSTFSTVSPGCASSFTTSSCTGRPTIMLDRACLFVSLVFTVPTYLPLRQHGDPVGHLHDLVELVGDEEDALPLPGELLHGGHQLLDLLRGEDGGGLVKDQDLVVPGRAF